jgi:hypothetical protein
MMVISTVATVTFAAAAATAASVTLTVEVRVDSLATARIASHSGWPCGVEGTQYQFSAWVGAGGTTWITKALQAESSLGTMEMGMSSAVTVTVVSVSVTVVVVVEKEATKMGVGNEAMLRVYVAPPKELSASLKY